MARKKAKPKPKPLTPAQKTRRRLNRDPLYQPAQQLSGANLSHAADALVKLEFNPTRKALQQESAQASTQGKAVQNRAGSYFTQLAEAERGNVERTQALGGLLQGRLADIGRASTTALDETQRRSQEVLGADQAVRGPGLGGDPSRLMEELAAARTRSTLSTQTAQQDATAQTGNYAGLADIARQARELRGGETVQQVANATQARLTDVASRRAALEAQVGPARTKNLLDLRQSGFENAATAAGLDLDQAKLQAQMSQDVRDTRLARAKLRSTNRQNRARNRLTRAQIRATLRGQSLSAATQRRGQDITAFTQQRGQNISASQQAANRASREKIARTRKAGKSLEPADARKVKQSVSNALALIRSGDMTYKGKTYTRPGRMLRDMGAPGIVVQAAMERNTGGLNYDTARELRQLGVRVPRSWLRGQPRRNPQKDRPGLGGH
jgi:hypothetical protein